MAEKSSGGAHREDNPLKPGSAPGGVGVLIKAFQVLEALADAGGPLPLKELARITGMPKGTLYRILQTLHTLGYVNQIEDSSHYYMSSQMAYLGRNARQEDIKLMVLPQMQALLAKFNETVNLGILEGPFIYYVAVLEANRSLAWRAPTGKRDSFHSTSLGRAIAAHLPQDHREALLDRVSQKAGADGDRLAKLLDGIAVSGVAYDIEETDQGVACIGVPVFIDDRVVGAISISVPTFRYTEALGREIGQTMHALDLGFRTNRHIPAQLGAPAR